MTIKVVAAVLAGASALTSGAQAKDFEPKEKGAIVLNVRATGVAPQGSDTITTLAGGPTGLQARASYDVTPTIAPTASRPRSP